MDGWMDEDDDDFVFVDGCKTHDAWWIDTLLVEESPPAAKIKKQNKTK